MISTFDNAKYSFYIDLRVDELVQSLGAEKPIRDLTERIITYLDHANQANYTFQRQRKMKGKHSLENLDSSLQDKGTDKITELLGKVTKSVEELQEQKMRPLALDFADVQAIAYHVGTYQDSRSWLQRKFTSVNPLDALVQEYAEHYEQFKQTGDIKHKYFDEEVVSHINIAANDDMQMNLRAKSLDEMLLKCCDYINRKGDIMILADAAGIIHSYYADEARDNLKRGFKDKDWSWLTANWKEERLSIKEIKQLAGYLQRRSEINGIRFKTLYLAYLKLKGANNPEQTTEELYQKCIGMYKQYGFINVIFDPSKK